MSLDGGLGKLQVLAGNARRVPATLAGTALEQPLKGIDPRSVSVAPVDPKSIGSHQGQRHWTNVGRDGGGVQDGPAGHFLDTGSAGTGQPEGTGREKALVPRLVPLNQQTVVPPIYREWCQTASSTILFYPPIHLSDHAS